MKISILKISTFMKYNFISIDNIFKEWYNLVEIKKKDDFLCATIDKMMKKDKSVLN